MKKRSAFVIALALAAPLAAGAAETSPAPAEPAAKEAAKPKKAEPCVEVASRIRRQKAGECAPSAAPTRSWSREDIQSTGENDMGQALRKLDPRFQ